MTTRARLFPALVLLGILGLFAPAAHAQMLVYRLEFKATGETINYRPYQNGFYVAPAAGGTGSLILTSISGVAKTYYEYAVAGSLFLAQKNQKRKAVISCLAGISNTTTSVSASSTTMFAIGDASELIELKSANSKLKVYCAKTLQGYALSADPEADLSFGGDFGLDFGVAGTAILTARYDSTISLNVNKKQATNAGALTVIEAELVAAGYKKGTPSDAGIVSPSD